jgi:hypothetical protein
MHQSKSIQIESHGTSRQKWQEPAILVERSLTTNAQEPVPNIGPAFGPLSDSPGSP